MQSIQKIIKVFYILKKEEKGGEYITRNATLEFTSNDPSHIRIKAASVIPGYVAPEAVARVTAGP